MELGKPTEDVDHKFDLEEVKLVEAVLLVLVLELVLVLVLVIVSDSELVEVLLAITQFNQINPTLNDLKFINNNNLSVASGPFIKVIIYELNLIGQIMLQLFQMFFKSKNSNKIYLLDQIALLFLIFRKLVHQLQFSWDLLWFQEGPLKLFLVLL